MQNGDNWARECHHTAQYLNTACWDTSQSNQKKKCQTKSYKKPFIVKDIPLGKVFHQHKLKIAACQICFPDSRASWSTDLKHFCVQSSFLSQYQCYTPLTKKPHAHFIITTKKVKQKASRDMMRKHRKLLPYSCQSKASFSTINWIVFEFYTVFPNKLLLFKG